MVLESLSLNTTDLISLIQPFFLKLSLLFGGIFGLYFIFILVNIYLGHKKNKILKDIKYDLDQLNKYFKIPHAPQRIPLWKKLQKHLSKSK